MRRPYSSVFPLGASERIKARGGQLVPHLGDQFTPSIQHRNHSREGCNTDRTSLTPKMSDEEITYTTVRFHKSSSKLENQGKSDETQGPRGASHRECSVSWHLIAIPLGILCSILLVAVSVLVTHIFQYSEKNHELQKTLRNLTQNFHILQNDNYLKEEMLRNKSRECDDLKHQKELASLNREENRCCGETKVVFDCIQRTGTHVEGHWFCCGIKCYFIMDNKQQWSGCKQTCLDCNLSLLKIDDDDELKFLKSRLTTNSYWIGLKYDERNRKWQWIGDVLSKLNLMTMKSLEESGSCAFLSFGGIHPDDCGIKHPCICEKRMDKFPDSVSV